MSTLKKMMSILKGVSLPDEAKFLRTEMKNDEPHDVFRHKDELIYVPHSVGVFPENPDDPHHGMPSKPGHHEGGDVGYHPEVMAHIDDPANDDDDTTTGALSELRAEAKTRDSKPEITTKAEHFGAQVLSELLKMQ